MIGTGGRFGMAVDVRDEEEYGEQIDPLLVDIDPQRMVRGAGGILAFGTLWWLVALTQPNYILPTPVAVAETFATEAASGAMLTALGNSIIHWAPER